MGEEQAAARPSLMARVLRDERLAQEAEQGPAEVFASLDEALPWTAPAPHPLANATFQHTACLQGDCSVQAYFAYGTRSTNLVDQVRQGLMAGDAPFEVTVTNTTPQGDAAVKVMVDPAVYKGLTTAPPEGPGLEPATALTMVTRLAVAQAMDPGASISWVDDGKGGGVLALDGSHAEPGQGLDAQFVRPLLQKAGLNLLDHSGLMALFANPSAENLNRMHGKSFVAFVTDPQTKTSHPTMVSVSVTPAAWGGTPTVVFNAPGMAPISQSAMSSMISNYYNGHVAPNSGFGTTAGKFPKKWPG